MRVEHIGAATLILADCRDALPTLGPVDAVVTDPPYGLTFMGKDWDRGVPGVEFWRLILAAMKPGAHLLSFGGTRTYHRMASAIEDAGLDVRDAILWHYGQGFPKHKNALKPATEIATLARRPGATGALNIDSCRIDAATDDDARRVRNCTVSLGYNGHGRAAQTGGHVAGRWPANVCHDGSEEVLRGFPETGVGRAGDRGLRYSGRHGGLAQGNAELKPGTDGVRGHSDAGGSAARYFYCAKASRADRGEGNDHPTVKPQALMRWLCRLITPPGGIALDPFMGSGSTGKAALAEGFRFVGIEREERYFDIACRRIEEAARQGDMLASVSAAAS